MTDLSCCPEWCAQEGTTHDTTCPDHPMMTMTKGDFVGSAEAGAAMAVDAYQLMLDEGFSRDDAKDAAIAEANESAVCFAGIGSCGRGWCKHS